MTMTDKQTTDRLTPDTLAAIDRASAAAARTYRLGRTTATAADVAADVAEAAMTAAEWPTDRDHVAAHVAKLARRAADKYRRRADRERPSGTAADVAGEATVRAADDTADRQYRAVMARPARHRGLKRTDVAAVAEWSRVTMRPADWQAARVVRMAAADRLAADVAAVLADAPTREADALARLAEAEAADVVTAAARVAVPVTVVRAVPVRPAEYRARLARLAWRARHRADKLARRAARAADRAAEAATADAEAEAEAARLARRADSAARMAATLYRARDTARHGRPARVGTDHAEAEAVYHVGPSTLADRLTAAMRERGSAATRRPGLLTWSDVARTVYGPDAGPPESMAVGRAVRRWAARWGTVHGRHVSDTLAARLAEADHVAAARLAAIGARGHAGPRTADAVRLAARTTGRPTDGPTARPTVAVGGRDALAEWTDAARRHAIGQREAVAAMTGPTVATGGPCGPLARPDAEAIGRAAAEWWQAEAARYRAEAARPSATLARLAAVAASHHADHVHGPSDYCPRCQSAD